MTNSRFKFRAWHKGYPGGRRIRTIEPKMLYENWPGEGLLWKEQGQPVEIMQWTGLIDKNGKPIFEGDVVVWFVEDVTRTGIVEYVTESCCYDLKNFRDEYHICNDWYRGEYEVIGNIYQDSHLLEAPQ